MKKLFILAILLTSCASKKTKTEVESVKVESKDSIHNSSKTTIRSLILHNGIGSTQFETQSGFVKVSGDGKVTVEVEQKDEKAETKTEVIIEYREKIVEKKVRTQSLWWLWLIIGVVCGWWISRKIF